jgi:hypothetical protein
LSGRCLLSSTQKKSLLRSLIDKVVLERVASDKVMTRLVWRGGAVTSQEVRVRVGSFARLSDAEMMEAAIVRMVREGHTDEEIAQSLTADGHHSPRHRQVLRSTITKIRLGHRLLNRPILSHVRDVGLLTIPELACKLGVSPTWIYANISRQKIQVRKHANLNRYLFPDKPETIRRFRQLLAGQIPSLSC